MPDKTSLFYLRDGKMLENMIKTDNLEKVKSNLENITKSILNEEFEAKPQKGACYTCGFKSIVIMWNPINVRFTNKPVIQGEVY